MCPAFAAQLRIFTAVNYMPLAEATAFMFSKPLFTTVVTYVLLEEVVGFVGVLVLVRPRRRERELILSV